MTLVKVPIPENKVYVSLIATAFIKNLEENIKFAKEGLMMLLNHGTKEKIKAPTEKDFMVESK